MRDGRLGQNAMAEVEDEGALPKRRQDRAHAAVELGSSGDEQQGIEIALHRHKALQIRLDPAEIAARLVNLQVDVLIDLANAS